MPGVDWIPGVAHLKAGLQAITGDTEGAKTTIVNFTRECPVVSQTCALVQYAVGDKKEAAETFRIGMGTINNVANSVPVVGHIKGGIHHMVGDHEGGNAALNAATRSSVVVGSGAVAVLTTGGIAAIPAGIAAGAAYDTAATIITDEPQGCIAAYGNAVDNPSAGSIFDAAAGTVGDGLAGHSGGQIGKQILKNNYKAVRAAKMDKLNYEMFDPKGDGGAAYRLGNDIRDLNIKIDKLNNVKPNLKPGEVAPKGKVVTVPACIDKINESGEIAPQPKVVPRDPPRPALMEEDALYHDSYVEANNTQNNKQQRQKILDERDKMTAAGKLHEAYKNGKQGTAEEILDLLNQNNQDPERPNFNWKKDVVCKLLTFWWLLLILPKLFMYTLVTQLNSVRQGLYHSFIRHIDQWRDVISIDNARLDPLMKEIERIAAAQNESTARLARDDFEEARRQLNEEIRNGFQVAMVEIQMLMYRFVQQNTTVENFLGRNINENGGEQLLFKVRTRNNGVVVMVICVSKQLFGHISGDNRPVRSIITIFFQRWDNFKHRILTQTKDEMQNKRKK